MRAFILNAILAIFALVALASAHPTGDEANPETFPDEYTSSGVTDATLKTGLETRQVMSDYDLGCSVEGEDRGKKKDLERAIKYIRKERKKGRGPKLPAEKCQTAACVNKTKVKWCNDNKEEKALPSWDNVADGAQVIHNFCVKKHKKVSGELGHNDHWRVQVYSEDCYMQPGYDYS